MGIGYEVPGTVFGHSFTGVRMCAWLPLRKWRLCMSGSDVVENCPRLGIFSESFDFVPTTKSAQPVVAEEVVICLDRVLLENFIRDCIKGRFDRVDIEKK